MQTQLSGELEGHWQEKGSYCIPLLFPNFLEITESENKQTENLVVNQDLIIIKAGEKFFNV